MLGFLIAPKVKLEIVRCLQSAEDHYDVAHDIVDPTVKTVMPLIQDRPPKSP